MQANAPVMLAGTILLAELMKNSGFKHLVVSESDFCSLAW